LAAAQKQYTQMSSNDLFARTQILTRLVELLLQLNRGPEAEALVAAQLKAETVLARQHQYRPAVESLVMLTAIYDRTDRSADVLRVLDGSALWHVPDLAQVSTSSFENTPLVLMAARALARTERKDDAQKVVRRFIQEFPGQDAGYALLLALGGDDLEGYLDRTFRFDRFEERPLIWKAKYLLDRGQVDLAEKTARAAIAIDPSDGEQGKGDRLRAYAVLGDILERKGDPAQAKLMRGAVEAIRLSEQADDWWEAGLLSGAVKRYEEALHKFADAYCIQSRLALRYSELGDFAKAEQYYRRAFELMPESFGRVESHCFGCEGAFAGERAQNIAEKVFAELAVKLPNRPQVFYLLGYLRSAQGRNPEAADHYRQAVTLDPDYLNAWKNLQGLSDEIELPTKEQETAALAIFRLDPTGHHAQPNMQAISDLRKFWGTICAIEKPSPPERPGASIHSPRHGPNGRKNVPPARPTILPSTKSPTSPGLINAPMFVSASSNIP